MWHGVVSAGSVGELEAAVSISEDEDKATTSGPSPAGFDFDGDDGTRQPPPAAKWGMAGLILAYAGLGSYCVATALGQGTGTAHPGGTSPALAAAPGKGTATAAGEAPVTDSQRGAAPAATPGQVVAVKAHAAKAFARAGAAAPLPRAQVLAAVSATAIGPAGASGDHPQQASLVIDGSSATSWITHWYETARFGNLKGGTGLVLDMGKMVTIRQVQLALGGSPGLWGADIQIRVGDSPDTWNQAPAAQCTDVGGWVGSELRTPATGRYVQIWFTRLPRDSWGTYQEHVYGVTIHGTPAHLTSPPGSAGGPRFGHGGPHAGDHHAGGGGHFWGGGYGGGHHGHVR